MPHVIVKMVSGKSDVQKKLIAEEIIQSIMKILECDEEVISVSMEDIERQDWPKIYETDIMNHPERLYKKPGYTM